MNVEIGCVLTCRKVVLKTYGITSSTQHVQRYIFNTWYFNIEDKNIFLDWRSVCCIFIIMKVNSWLGGLNRASRNKFVWKFRS